MKLFRAIACLLMLGATAVGAGTEDAGPELALRINGHGGTEKALELWRGEPVLVEVVLRQAERGGKAIVLEPPTGSWATRVKAVVTDGAGADARWAFVVAGKASAAGLALQPDAVSTLVLRMEAKDSAGLVAGKYRMLAKLELADGKGWRGIGQSEAVDVEVMDGPADPKGELLGRRQLLRVSDALLAGDVPRAEGAMRDMLRADSGRPEGFVAMALLAEAKGRRGLALAAIDMAMTRAVQGDVKPPTKPAKAVTGIPPRPVPLEYYDLRQRFEAMPQGAGATTGPATPGR
jgi:hypothetical protein